jgi:hypothetical protein
LLRSGEPTYDAMTRPRRRGLSAPIRGHARSPVGISGQANHYPRPGTALNRKRPLASAPRREIMPFRCLIWVEPFLLRLRQTRRDRDHGRRAAARLCVLV